MEPLTITIQPPITEHCSKCDYESSYSFYSKRVTCPNCGEKSVRQGARPSKQQAIYVTSNVGNYSLSHPKEIQMCYNFYNVPNGKNIVLS